MVRKKQIAARLLAPLGVLKMMQRLRSDVFAQLPILTYHRVLSWNTIQDFPFDERLISASVSEFEEQMRYVAENYSAITFNQLVEWMDGHAPLPRKPIMITFDDGYDDLYLNTFPILKKYELKATVFVATGLIGGSETYWNDFVAYVVKYVDCERLRINCIGYDKRISNDQGVRTHVLTDLIEKLKELPDQHRLRAIDEIRGKYGAVYENSPEIEKSKSRMCNWGQCEEMSKFGIDFGSQSVTHPILTKLEPDLLQAELTISRETIIDRLGIPVTAIAYPNGQRPDYDESVVEACRNAGYRLAATFHGGTNSLRRLSHFRLNRINVEPRNDFRMLPFTLAFPTS